jgi:hypothetical protein
MWVTRQLSRSWQQMPMRRQPSALLRGTVNLSWLAVQGQGCPAAQ